MTPEELDAWKSRMDAVIKQENSPAGRAMRRMALEWMAGSEQRAQAQTPRPPRERTERERLLDSGLIFSVREQDRADSDAAHRARRRLAQGETEARERVWQRLRDSRGPDAADAWLRDAG